MRIKIFQIIVFFSFIIIFHKISAQSISAISIISSDITFIRTEVTKSSTGPVSRNGKVAQVITYYEDDYYSLKLSIKINENIEAPLDIRLTSSKGDKSIYRLDENTKLLMKDEFYYYDIEIVLKETGWYKLEIGDFSKNANCEINNIVFDESSIYVKK